MPPEPARVAEAAPVRPSSTPATTIAATRDESNGGSLRPPGLAGRWLAAFGRFWWDFLVGDTPELLIGVLVALGVVALLVRASSLNAAAVAGLPVMAALLLGLSAWRAARTKRGG